MDKLLLVDGMNLLFQMFFGMPARIVNAQGKAIQGTLGFVGALGKILRMTNPTHMAVLFDGECENPRTLLDASYKADREDFSDAPEEENPFSQLPDVYAALDVLKIRYAETENCEFDDWAAAYAHRYGDTMEVVIASQDSDFFQLITENVTVLRYRGDKSVLCDEAYIRQKLGIEPNQYADFKALTGDSADHIRGAEGIGPKTAAKLLGQFKTLENLLNFAREISRPAVRESVLRNAQRLRTNYQLIKLGEAGDLPFPLETLAYTPTNLTTHQVLQTIGLR
ncbi:MAG: flap endonuclease [Ruminococcaceae bacterium]|nr:flap endonuclease [Oscillospiraceae bacterium]